MRMNFGSQGRRSWGRMTAGSSMGGASDTFGKALQELSSTTGDVEKMYQAGKRRTLSDIAIASVNAGMANSFNLPAASIAYDEANRPATNVALAQLRAGVLQALAGTQAQTYNQRTALDASRYNAEMSAAAQVASAGERAEYARYLQQLKGGDPNYYATSNTFGHIISNKTNV